MQPTKIRILPDSVANLIAAGEVVERPASVVKELAENAIDAGAAHVSVRVTGAGAESIVVEDDGSGMGREDAVLALKRHATSKIAGAEDLERIGTLGFRGEALPSIASVSRMTMTTRPRESDEATLLSIEDGVVVRCEAAGGAPGTRVEVRDLFHNTPARRKFLRNDATEMRNIVETVAQLALIHPLVAFELSSRGRTLLALPPGQSLEARTAEVTGLPAAAPLHWARAEAGGRRLTFAFAPPHEGRGNRKSVRLFVNRRSVNDRILFRALMEGYKGLLEANRYPVAVLWLELPGGEVDVNVHPAKREVRFRDEGGIFRWVAGCVAQALAEVPWARGGEGLPPGGAGAGRGPGGYVEGGGTDPRVSRVAEAIAAYTAGVGRGGAQRPLTGNWGPSGGVAQRGESPGPGGRAGLAATQEVGALAEDGSLETGFGNLRYLGAFDATYLLFEETGTRELVIVDQHAAHERILYEIFLGRASAAPAMTQALLVPVVVECSAGEMALFPERKEALESIGIEAEPFGLKSLSVTRAPAGLGGAAVSAVVRDLLGADAEDGEGAGGKSERMARRAACAAAVKARMALLPSEVRELMIRLDGCRHPAHCPHGRPLLVRWGRTQVEGFFHRR